MTDEKLIKFDYRYKTDGCSGGISWFFHKFLKRAPWAEEC